MPSMTTNQLDRVTDLSDAVALATDAHLAQDLFSGFMATVPAGTPIAPEARIALRTAAQDMARSIGNAARCFEPHKMTRVIKRGRSVGKSTSLPSVALAEASLEAVRNGLISVNSWTQEYLNTPDGVTGNIGGRGCSSDGTVYVGSHFGSHGGGGGGGGSSSSSSSSGGNGDPGGGAVAWSSGGHSIPVTPTGVDPSVAAWREFRERVAADRVRRDEEAELRRQEYQRRMEEQQRAVRNCHLAPFRQRNRRGGQDHADHMTGWDDYDAVPPGAWVPIAPTGPAGAPGLDGPVGPEGPAQGPGPHNVPTQPQTSKPAPTPSVKDGVTRHRPKVIDIDLDS